MELLDRYAAKIEEGLRGALRGESSLYEILRYHIGLTDADGQRVTALGKLIRPTLVLFVAEELGGRVDAARSAAVGLELIHGFSLIHDDLQDGDEVRRGRPAVWTRWGSAEAINAGDLMHAIALKTALRAGSGVANALAEATCEMIEGQSMDLAFEHRFVTEDDYLKMVDRKTGGLFRCAFELGGRCAGASQETLADLRKVGSNVGRAFQIRDDLLGIWGNDEMTGKPTGSDVRRRKKSYPPVVAHAEANAEERDRLERIYANGEIGEEDIAWVVGFFDRLGVRDRARTAIEAHSAQAVSGVERLPFSAEGKRLLRALIEALTRRTK